MSLSNSEKLKKLYKILPPNVVVSSSWLQKQDISMQLRYKYVKNGWLHTLGKSAYIINPKNYSWQSLVVGIQHFMKLPYHIGGLKALELQGFAHYLPLGNKEDTITLYGTKEFPAFLKNLKVNHKITLQKKPYFNDLGIKEINSNIDGYSIKVSAPERAIFELIYLVEKEGMSFEFISEIFEGLTNLRPNIINELLKSCNNRKVKRVFCFFMDFYNHPWRDFVDSKSIDFGKGLIQIVKGGTVDKKYLITIPKEFSNVSK